MNAEDWPVWLRQLGERATMPDFDRWRQMVASAGGCTHPIRLVGQSSTVDTATGEILSSYDTRDEPTGYILTACGNRRMSRCEPCARVYADDTFHLIRSGLAGGRDVPESVATHPRVFATFTAPTFGPVHSRVDTRPCHPRATGPSCRLRHSENDPVLGQPIDPGTYDYPGAILWNNHAGKLWHVFTVYLRRHLAELLGVPRSKLSSYLRVEYAKVAEYQSRGLVHFHAVIRLDGPGGPTDPPPLDTEALTDAISAAARAARVSLPDRTLRWGKQLDIRPISSGSGWSDQQVARYIAKYATKGAEAAGTINRPLKTIKHLHRVRSLTPHARRMIETCWSLADTHPDRHLRDWAHMLGYGGHFSTKSRHYSTTLGAMRTDRARHRADEAREYNGLPPLPTDADRIGSWHVLGTGYRTTAEETWAETIREQKHRG
ncbi:replication initiator [Actinokineospora sp. NBRC 105648]|uniref:replication initiator n=1 Tax=Actinokineospora sp. NBRC 105648 TaxID=3032206 RepID=UPI0024A322CB|nr:replication initiator [Actinokineospora sp. NBRC 105648]GLZ42450.1 replication initiation protein [Actinokineospora sp. NBRC 105648]